MQGFAFFLEQPFLPVSSHYYSANDSTWTEYRMLHKVSLEWQTDPTEVPKFSTFTWIPSLPMLAPSPDNWLVSGFLLLSHLEMTIECLCVLNVFYCFLLWTLVKSWPGTWLPDVIFDYSICSREMQLCKQCSKSNWVHNHEIAGTVSDIHYTDFSIFYLARELKYSLKGKHSM